MIPPIVRVRLDVGAAIEALAALSTLAKTSQRSPEIIDGLVYASEFLARLIRLDTDSSLASGTLELVVRLNPTDGLRILAAAIRAGESDAMVVEHMRASCFPLRCLTR
jgi:hypothetical protein